MLNPNLHNSQNSSPDSRINNKEFNDIALKFGSFLSMSQNKCLNHVNTLSIIMKSSLIKSLFMKLIGSDNIYELIQLYIDNTPNLYKKVAKKILFR
jgi:hypothetical protein